MLVQLMIVKLEALGKLAKTARGRAEEEQKVQLGFTAEQINNRQSTCGSVCLILLDMNFS